VKVVLFFKGNNNLQTILKASKVEVTFKVGVQCRIIKMEVAE